MSALNGQSLPQRRFRAPLAERSGQSGSSTNPVVLAKRQQAAEAKQDITTDMENLLNYVHSTFQQMADKYDKKVQYFQELFFQRGLHTVHRREKPNTFNSFKAVVAANRREEGESGMTAVEIALNKDYKKQYQEMTEEERDEMVRIHQAMKDSYSKTMRLSGKSSAQDAAFTFGQITSLIQGLRDRVGVEAFCMVVRSKPNFYMQPLVFFTCKELEDYMHIAVPRWDSVRVSTLLESFAVSGCDPTKAFRNNKDKAIYLKGEIAAAIGEGLTKVTGLSKISMQYKNYERKIELDHGVTLDGWPEGIEFKNPSEMSTSIPALEQLLRGLKSGTIVWRKIGPAVLMERKRRWDDKVARGDAQEPARKRRKDAGVARKHHDMDTDEDNDTPSEDDENVRPARPSAARKKTVGKGTRAKATTKKGRKARGVRSAAVVPDDADEGRAEGGGASSSLSNTASTSM
ncbi:hypothetical protein K523DRAFT_358028 [Schizophyllum commune Tattone D]|nr:hypothetical protein K523DRAFT_358028 [Schizophyllum commune Tattone D]